MIRVLYSPRFLKQYKKLPSEIKDLVEKQQARFLANPFDPSLKTHKLHGVLRGFYAFSVSYSFRIIFEFMDGNTVFLHEVGKHDIYD